MRVPAKVLNAIVFLGYRELDNEGKSVEKWGGTGLLVAVDEGNILFPYIVTAHHVAVKINAESEPIARINDANGNGHHYRLHKPVRYKLDGEHRETNAWYRHPTDVGADVAEGLERLSRPGRRRGSLGESSERELRSPGVLV